MLQRIRERISGWIAGVIIALVGGAFILFGVEYYFQQNSGNTNRVATVNGVTLSEQQVNNTLSNIQKQAMSEMHTRTLSSSVMKELKSYALQSMVTSTALETTLEKEGFRVGLNQIKMMIEQAPEFQSQGRFSQQKFMQTLYAMNITPTQFFQHMRSQWIIQETMGAISNSAFVLPSEVSHIADLQNQQRAFGYMVIPSKLFTSKIHISDADVKSNYDANASLYQTPEQVSVSYIKLSPTDLEKNASVSIAEAQSYYQSHLSNYQTPKQWKISQVTIPLSENASQADMTAAQTKVNNIIKNPTLATNNSSQITISAAEINPAMQNILSGLTLDHWSAPIRTANGISALKLLKVDPMQTHSFESVQGKIKEMLQHQRVNDALTKKAGQLSDLTYTNPDSLTDASSKLNLPIQTSGLMSSTGEKSGLFSNPALLAAVFSDSVLKDGNNSNPIGLPDGSQVVVRIAKKIPSHPIPLATVESTIKQTLIEKQASAQAGLLAYQLQQQIVKGMDPVMLAKKNNVRWQTVALMARGKKSTVPAPIVSTAFSIAVSSSGASRDSLGVQTLLLDQKNYAVVAVKQVKSANSPLKSSAANQKIAQKMSYLWAQLTQHCFTDSVMANSKIKIYPTNP